MKRLAMIVLLIVLAGVLSAQLPYWHWVMRGGGADNDHGKSIAVDALGNSYLAGDFYGNPYIGNTLLSSSGQNDIYIAKLDSQGNWLWARQAGGTGNDGAESIVVDSAGNVFVTGYFSGTVTFASTTLTCYGGWDVFVAKLDTNGYLQWVVQSSGASYESVSAIALDGSGNLLITGFYNQTAIFGTTSLAAYGGNDIFVAKLDNEGNWLWARRAGGPGEDAGSAIAADNAGNSYVTGYFSETAAFAFTNLTSYGSIDVFIAKLGPDGALLGAFKAGSTEMDGGTGIGLDAAGNVYIAGYLSGTTEFGPFNVAGFGGRDIFVAKMNSGAIYQWARLAGSDGWDEATALSVMPNGTCFITGNFLGSANFATIILTSWGQNDIFISCLDSNGFMSWVERAGGQQSDWGKGIAADNSGYVYITGDFMQGATFGMTTLTSQGILDCYVGKLYSGVVGNDDSTAPANAQPSLLGIYPNPVRQGNATKVQFNKALPDNGTVTIYNLKGQLIKNLAVRSGTELITLDNTDLPPSVYLCSLKTGRSISVRKLVILK